MNTVTAEHRTSESRNIVGSLQYVYQFPNGRGASIIGAGNIWELAVLDEVGTIDTSTALTHDTLKWLQGAEVNDLLDAIAALPDRSAR